jgi:hypothetical protein
VCVYIYIYISILLLQIWIIFMVFNFKNRLRIFDNRVVLRKILCSILVGKPDGKRPL